jgi:hypothetical protein
VSENSSEIAALNRAPTVVVGVDGSVGAQEALRWALAEVASERPPCGSSTVGCSVTSVAASKETPTWAGRSVGTPQRSDST